jgi:lipopolysaccharide/colanic/teichoic acid biosynthesis glycosyltransferase
MRGLARGWEHEDVGAHVLNENLFRGVLTRERKRSDRSNRAFVLLVLGMSDASGPGASVIPAAAIDAVAVVKRQTDVAGWLQARTLLAVIIADIPTFRLLDAGEEIGGRLRGELAKLDGLDAKRYRVEVRVYPEPKRPGTGTQWAVDPLFYPELWPARRLGTTYDILKRTLDIVGSLTLLISLAPLMLVIAVLVKSGSRGPVLFKQMRVGWMMKSFTMLKFRTMVANADPKVHQDYVSAFIEAGANGRKAATNGLYKLTTDRRITWIGAVLRKTSLDELPQLWNVLRGEMSLVGPRPPLPYEVDRYGSWHRARILEAKPGMTGLWQVTGRSTTTFDEMVRLDIRYARERSFWTDVKILLATPGVVLSGKGAE